MASKRCFVISPIGDPGSKIREHADAVFQGIIAPALEILKPETGEITAIRSDQLQEPGNLSRQMFREIFQNDFCIAVLTFSNPNVFYELAVAQCAYRPLVALVQEGDRLPFDIADLRSVPYNLQDMLRLINRRDATELAGHLRTMLSGTWTPPDPFGANAPALWSAVRDPLGLQKVIETARPKPLPPGVDSAFRLPGEPARRIVIRTGDIRQVRDVDVLVISENTDLQLARYYDPSVSGTLRYLDAERGLDGRVTRDTLDEGLKALMQKHDVKLPVMPGTVIVLPTSGLASLGIKYVFLGATARGEGVGSGYSPVGRAEIENCIRNCFEHFSELAPKDALESILFPVFGAGTAKQDPQQAADFQLPVIVEAMRATPSCKQANVIAWVESHRTALRTAALRLGLEPEDRTIVS